MCDCGRLVHIIFIIKFLNLLIDPSSRTRGNQTSGVATHGRHGAAAPHMCPTGYMHNQCTKFSIDVHRDCVCARPPLRGDRSDTIVYPRSLRNGLLSIVVFYG